MPRLRIPTGFWAILLLNPIVRADEQPPDSPPDLQIALAKAKIGLVQALDLAQKAAPKASLIAISLTTRRNAPVYEVELRDDSEDRELAISALDGEVLKENQEAKEPDGREMVEKENEKEGAEERDEHHHPAEPAKLLAEAKWTWKQAVESALLHATQGKAHSARLYRRNRTTVYDVGIAAGRKCYVVSIDAGSGKVLAMTRQYATAMTWNFDTDPEGKLPEEWIVRQTNPARSSPQWHILSDSAAPSPPNVLALNVATGTGSTFNLAIADDSSFKDLDMSVKIRANTGDEDQGGGLIWRCKDENNYYVCRINPLENNYRVYRVINGKREQLETKSVKIPAGQWHLLRVVMIGNEITCYLNDRKLLHTKDATFKEPGRIGLWTKADAASSFDDLTVTTPAEKHKN